MAVEEQLNLQNTGDSAAQQILQHAKTLTIGKRLPDAVYIHTSALTACPALLRDEIQRIADAAKLSLSDHNVLKLSVLKPRVSFLQYADFDENPFPVLARAASIDLSTRKITERTYDPKGNPPVLHRKETLLAPGDVRFTLWRRLTEELEKAGLFQDAESIGRKLSWASRLQVNGYSVVDHQLLRTQPTLAPAAPVETVTVLRHRTAIERTVLSTPVQHLWRYGLLEGDTTFFDYGCGRGGDLKALQAAGVDAVGWDPYFHPEAPKRPSAVVNIGFVLNVIENPIEREAALVSAYALATKLLVVAVMIGGDATTDRFQRFGDGVLTQRNTFQKYFTQEEIRRYIERTVGREPIAVAPGVFFLFRDDDEEQAFLESQQRSAVPTPNVPRQPTTDRESPRRSARTATRRLEPSADLLDSLWEFLVANGRVPQKGEFHREDELRTYGRLPSIVQRTIERGGAEVFERATNRRRGDLLTFLAMNQFEKRRSRGKWTPRVRKDLTLFFGSPKRAEENATELLFSIATPGVLLAAAQQAQADGLGFLDAEHSLQLETKLLKELPAVLRVYTGCASRLYGDFSSADLIKLHLGSGKVTILFYDDFHEQPFPSLRDRIKINLKTQQIEFFRYGNEYPLQPLYNKSRFLAKSAPHYDEQCNVERELQRRGLLTGEGFGPTLNEFARRLVEAKVELDGFSVVDHA